MTGTGKTILSQSSNTVISKSNFGSNVPVLSRVLENAGMVSLILPSSTNFQFNSGTFKNLSAGTFNANVDSTTNFTSLGPNNLFDNAGTFNKTGTAILNSNVPLANSGTINVYDGLLDLDSGSNSGTINMMPGAALALSSSFTNSGTINVYEPFSTSPTSSAFAAGGVINSSTGRINFMSGNWSASGGGVNNSGEIYVASGASIASGGSAAGSKIIGPGSVSFSGPAGNFAGKLEVTGSVTLANSASVSFTTDQTIAADLILVGGTIDGTANVHITAPLTWASGMMRGSGKTTIAEGTLATLGLGPSGAPAGTMTLQRVLENAGTINYAPTATTGAALTFNNGTLKNLGTFNANPAANNTLTTTGASQLENVGTFNKLGGAPMTANVPMLNSGEINVQGGSLTLNAGSNSGTITMALGTRLVLSAGFSNSGVINLYEQNTLSSLSSFQPNGFTNASTGRVNLLAGNWTTNSAFNNSGEVHIASGSNITFNNTLNAPVGSKFVGPGSVTFTSAVNNLQGSLDVTGTVGINNSVTINTN